MSNTIRVRFAPSPTGPLHIGGVRTALFNYLWARKNKGSFILRIEDTDQTRYVEGAEKYIKESLEWLGLEPDESPWKGGPHGPYRQSDRKSMYKDYVHELIKKDKAYYAFDTPEELEAAREQAKEQGQGHFRYDAATRRTMINSLTLDSEEVSKRLSSGAEYVVRMKIEPDQEVSFQDRVRGEVTFSTNELDDKVILKSDGMPTYHLANVVDDHLMQISDVIRGEEWLSSTAHHILLYHYFEWEESMPTFAHLPLILKPTGKGKLSKRDGQKLGIPVFPMDWKHGDDFFEGFKELGFRPDALSNFLALLGWNPGTEEEIFDASGIIAAFDLDKVSKSGAKFDFEKALWFNQQYILSQPESDYLKGVADFLNPDYSSLFARDHLERILLLFKDRIKTYAEISGQVGYMFGHVTAPPAKQVRKRYNPELHDLYMELIHGMESLETYEADSIKTLVSDWCGKHELGLGKILPLLRLATTGTAGGPDIFLILELLTQEVVVSRARASLEEFSKNQNE